MDESIKNKIIEAIKTKNQSVGEVASKLFMSERQLRLLLKSWGVELVKKRNYRVVEKPEREELMKVYQEERTTAKVAEHYDTNVNTVNRWMKQLKIPTRKMKLSEKDKIEYLEEHLGKLKDFDI
ncbi:MAG: hypothetical protein WC303_02300 [Candidatus Paceibacterota bacterium]|jgi:DNA-directed RNA polymerase specialized sigma24 family protein